MAGEMRSGTQGVRTEGASGNKAWVCRRVATDVGVHRGRWSATVGMRLGAPCPWQEAVARWPRDSGQDVKVTERLLTLGAWLA